MREHCVGPHHAPAPARRKRHAGGHATSAAPRLGWPRPRARFCALRRIHRLPADALRIYELQDYIPQVLGPVLLSLSPAAAYRGPNPPLALLPAAACAAELHTPTLHAALPGQPTTLLASASAPLGMPPSTFVLRTAGNVQPMAATTAPLLASDGRTQRVPAAFASAALPPTMSTPSGAAGWRAAVGDAAGMCACAPCQRRGTSGPMQWTTTVTCDGSSAGSSEKIESADSSHCGPRYSTCSRAAAGGAGDVAGQAARAAATSTAAATWTLQATCAGACTIGEAAQAAVAAAAATKVAPVSASTALSGGSIPADVLGRLAAGVAGELLASAGEGQASAGERQASAGERQPPAAASRRGAAAARRGSRAGAPAANSTPAIRPETAKAWHPPWGKTRGKLPSAAASRPQGDTEGELPAVTGGGRRHRSGRAATPATRR
eukprot:361684-Chlamydomonas_euryale.AAC.10